MTYAAITQLIIDNLPSNSVIQAVKHRAVEQAILDFIQANIAQSGDIKRVKVNLAYLTANFETNGLGKNLRLGWAICNGNNGTDNLAGTVGVAYGLGFTGLGDSLGSADTVLVAHTHAGTAAGPFTGTNIAGGGGFSGGTNIFRERAITLQSAGESGVGKNYQPSIINLYIMKV